MNACKVVLLTRSQVCSILGFSEVSLRSLLECGFLRSPNCEDGLNWRPSDVLQFLWRRFNDSDFDSAVQLLVAETDPLWTPGEAQPRTNLLIQGSRVTND